MVYAVLLRASAHLGLSCDFTHFIEHAISRPLKNSLCSEFFNVVGSKVDLTNMHAEETCIVA